MHGDKIQSERTRILESFLAGDYEVLVCTGIMGRGLDLRCVKQVCEKAQSYNHKLAQLITMCTYSIYLKAC